MEKSYTTNIPKLSDFSRERKKRRKAERSRFYNKTDHGQQATSFYQSPSWRNIRMIKMMTSSVCELSLVEHQVISAEHVHHIIKFLDQPSEDVQWQLFLDPDNLMSLSTHMHMLLHSNYDALTDAQKELIQNKRDALIKKYSEQGIALI